uniref:Proteasome subunit alpha type n=1 Tax=Oryza nivara TaxID=4536 RepID=A0A0E0J4A0_ORYNI
MTKCVSQSGGDSCSCSAASQPAVSSCFLQQPKMLCRTELTLQEAETIALSILKQVMEEKVTPNNVDIAKVSPNYHLYTPAEYDT